MSEKSSEKRKMSTLQEASVLVRQIAGPNPAGDASDSVKAAITRAYNRIRDWKWSRVRDVWYADERLSVSGDEIEHLKAVASSSPAGVKKQPEPIADQKARDEYRSLHERIARLESLLLSQDQDFHSATLDGLRSSTLRNRRKTDQARWRDSALGSEPV